MTTDYSIDEHSKFKESILKNLSSSSKITNVQVTADGTTTANNNILYTFIFKGNNITTTEYCIVGDYKVVIVCENNSNNDSEIDQVAEDIIDSFSWK